MKKLILICTVAFIALAQQSCTATFHASNRHPRRHGSHVTVHVDNHPGVRKYPKKYPRKYRKAVRRSYTKPGKHAYGMTQPRNEPPRHPEPPRRSEPPRRPRR